jgi:hypothetical protein
MLDQCLFRRRTRARADADARAADRVDAEENNGDGNLTATGEIVEDSRKKKPKIVKVMIPRKPCCGGRQL